MRVARLHAPGKLQLHDEPQPLPAAGETLLRVRAVGVCGSDLHWFDQGEIGDAKLVHPLVLGHEAAGATAAGVRVAVDPAIPCRKCEWCRRGDPNLCPDVRFAGHAPEDGAMREWISWPEACLHPLPPTVTDAEGALLEPLGVALHAVDLGQLRAGMTIGVFGCGPIGLLILQLARLSGASSIIATDVLQHRLDAAKSFGAHRIVLVSPGDDSAISSMSSGGSGMDVAFEVAGEQGAVDDAISLVSPGGKVILVGIPVDDRTSFTASAARRKGLTIKLVRRMKHTYARAIDLVAQGMVDVRSLVTHRFALDDVDKAFKAARQREGLKVIIEM